LELTSGLKVIDLTNHVDGSLDNWIQYLNMTEKYDVSKAELTDYYNRVMNDARATYYLGKFLEDFYYYECGIPLQITVGAAAMKLFTMKYFTDYWGRDSDFISLYERKAYYGGRTELFKRGKIKTYSYDVNSMYLSIMRDCLLPDIATTKYIEKPPKRWRRYLTDYLGIWNIKVKTPDNIYLPILPVRMGGKLKFPKGIFEGVWTSVEINEAVKQGYEILEVYNFIYYSRSKPYFNEYAKFIWSKRQEYKKAGNKGMDIMVKKLGNTLYGKFAQRNGNEFFGRLSDYKKTLPDKVKFIEYHGETWVHITGEATPAKFEFPVISAFITSYARLKLHSAMLANANSLIYVDTDSLKLKLPAADIAIGKELGEWALEVDGDIIEYHRPKLYGDKRKGVPKRAELVKRTNKLEVWKYTKPLRYREAIRRGLTPNVWIEVYKELTFADDKRDWTGNKSQPLLYDKDSEYNDWLARRIAPTVVYGADDTAADYPEYDKIRDQEKQDRWRERAAEAIKYHRQLTNF